MGIPNYEYQSEFARTYFQQGREEGLRPLVHLFERRLGRALSAAERATLTERLRKQGPDRVGDVVLDLSPAELSAWLGAGNES